MPATGFSVVGVVLMAALENLIGIQLLGQYSLDDIPAGESEDSDGFTKPVNGGYVDTCVTHTALKSEEDPSDKLLENQPKGVELGTTHKLQS